MVKKKYHFGRDRVHKHINNNYCLQIKNMIIAVIKYEINKLHCIVFFLILCLFFKKKIVSKFILNMLFVRKYMVKKSIVLFLREENNKELSLILKKILVSLNVRKRRGGKLLLKNFIISNVYNQRWLYFVDDGKEEKVFD